jgi:hypothetical protein
MEQKPPTPNAGGLGCGAGRYRTSSTRSCSEKGASSESSAKPCVMSFSARLEQRRTFLVAVLPFAVRNERLGANACAENKFSARAHATASRRWNNIDGIVCE